MAARLKKHQTESVRQRIKIGMIISQFQRCVAGEIELTTAQINAGKALLDKSLPSLTSADVTTHQPESQTPEELLRSLEPLLGPEMTQRLADQYLPKGPVVVHAPGSETLQ